MQWTDRQLRLWSVLLALAACGACQRAGRSHGDARPLAQKRLPSSATAVSLSPALRSARLAFAGWIAPDRIRPLLLPGDGFDGSHVFGCALALSGQELFVADPAGGVCLYRHRDGRWQDAGCLQRRPEAWGRAMGPLALSGHLLAVGAAEGNVVEIYRRRPQGLALETKLTRHTRVGESLSWAADTLFVGTPYAETSGAVLVYARGRGSWTQVQTLPSVVSRRQLTRFGHALAYDRGLLAVAANAGEWHDLVEPPAVVFLFAERGASWVEVARLPDLRQPVLAGDWLGGWSDRGIELYQHTEKDRWVRRQVIKGCGVPRAIGPDWMLTSQCGRSLALFGLREGRWVRLSEVVIPLPELALMHYRRWRESISTWQVTAVSDGRWVFVTVAASLVDVPRVTIPHGVRTTSATAIYEILRSDAADQGKVPRAR